MCCKYGHHRSHRHDYVANVIKKLIASLGLVARDSAVQDERLHENNWLATAVGSGPQPFALLICHMRNAAARGFPFSGLISCSSRIVLENDGVFCELRFRWPAEVERIV